MVAKQKSEENVLPKENQIDGVEEAIQDPKINQAQDSENVIPIEAENSPIDSGENKKSANSQNEPTPESKNEAKKDKSQINSKSEVTVPLDALSPENQISDANINLTDKQSTEQPSLGQDETAVNISPVSAQNTEENPSADNKLLSESQSDENILNLEQINNMLESEIKNINSMSAKDYITSISTSENMRTKVCATIDIIIDNFEKQDEDLQEMVKMIVTCDELIHEKLKSAKYNEFNDMDKTLKTKQDLRKEKANILINTCQKEYQSSHELSVKTEPLRTYRLQTCKTLNDSETQKCDVDKDEILNSTISEKDTKELSKSIK